MQTVCAPFVPQGAATHGKNLPAVVSKPPPSGTRYNGSLDRCRNIEAFDSELKAWFYQEAETDRSTFAVISLWGKFGGLCACAATFPYIVPLLNIFPTRLFSRTRLKRKDFQEIVRLTWAQEVSSSNLDAPTNSLSRTDLQSIILALLHFGANLGTFGNVQAEK